MENITDSKLLSNELKDNFFTDYSKIYDFAEIKTFAEGVLGEKRYTIGKVAGTLNTMISNNEIQRIEKGKYKVIPKEIKDSSMKEVVNLKLRYALGDIEHNLSKLNVISLPADEFQTFLKIRKLLDDIKSSLDDL